MAEAGKTRNCCEELKEALEGGDFEPCLTVGPNEIITDHRARCSRGRRDCASRPSDVLLPFLRKEASDGGRSRSQAALTPKAT